MRWIVRKAEAGDATRIGAAQVMARCRAAPGIRTTKVLRPGAAHSRLSCIRDVRRGSARLGRRRVERGCFRRPGRSEDWVIRRHRLRACAPSAASAQAKQEQQARQQHVIARSLHARSLARGVPHALDVITLKRLCQSVPKLALATNADTPRVNGLEPCRSTGKRSPIAPQPALWGSPVSSRKSRMA